MEKEVILLVGNMGSGKSTLAGELMEKYADIGAAYISQDYQGKDKHWTYYNDSLKEDYMKIIVDRINHTKEQRKKYIDLAKKAGYVTTIIDITCTPDESFHRITNRKSHPTLNKETPNETILKALYMYYSQYEKPENNEADNVNDNTIFNPYMLDLTQELKDRKYMIIGDIHGCHDETMALLSISNYVDVVIATGDLVDRGPKIRETLEYFMNTPHTYSVMGNHEYKLLRYLLGNKVTISKDLQKSIDQLTGLNKYDVALYLMSLPKIIKVDNNFVVHAGVDTSKPMSKQENHSLFYARDWTDKVTSYTNINIFYGHNYSPTVNVAPQIYALDGNCVYGNELRAMVMPSQELLVQKAFETYVEKKEEQLSIVDEFENEVALGNVRKTVKDHLVLYCYTEKCNYENNWNEINQQARGVIFNRFTGECMARPFHKFFNIGEKENTKVANLPNETYEVFDKVDGSLGILYWLGDKPMIATKGSFESPQAQEAMKILVEKTYDIKLKSFDKDITLLFEIIYPENRNTPGAMLVTDYGKTRDLMLLAAINRKTNVELSRQEVEKISEKIGFPLVLKYDLTIQQMIEMQKTLPKEREGFVIRFANRLRVKIKGDEYMKIHRLLNNLTPLFLWENMKNGRVPMELITEVPEEHKDYANEMITKLEIKYINKMDTLLNEIDKMHGVGIWGNTKDKAFMKNVGLYIQQFKPIMGGLFFPKLLERNDVVDYLLMKTIRPKDNIL
jgi:RNA ligase